MFRRITLQLGAAALIFGASAEALAERWLASAGGAAASQREELMALRLRSAGEAPSCSSAEVLAARVEDYLGRVAFDPASPRSLDVDVELTPEGTLRGWVRVTSDAGVVLGEREIVADEPTCEALEEPLVLAIALLVDSDLGQEAPPPPPPEAPLSAPEEEEEEEDEPFTEPVVVVLRPEPEPPRAPRPWRARVDGSVVGVEGLLPRFGGGAEVGVLVEPPSFVPLRVRAFGLAPRELTLSPRGSLEFGVVALGLSPCWTGEEQGALRVDLCGGVDAVVQRARSTELDEARSVTRVFLQGALQVRVIAELGAPWFGVLSAGASFPFQPPEFVVRREGEKETAFRAAEASFLVGAGVGARFGP